MMTLPFRPLGFVRDEIITNNLGLPKTELVSKKKTGVFIEGIHWRMAGDNRIVWNFENIQEWLATSEPRKAG